MLNKDTKLNNILTEGCRVVSKKGKSLANILSPSEFSSQVTQKTWLSQQGFHPCGGKLCNTCKYVNKKKDFQNTN